MKKWLFILIGILVVSNIIFITTTIKNKQKADDPKVEVYAFEGENEDIKLTNGLIIIEPNKQTVYGGNIIYVGEPIENITTYSTKIYVEKDGMKDVLYHGGYSNEGTDEDIAFPDELILNPAVGAISGENVIGKKDIEALVNNFYVSLSGSMKNGKTFEFPLQLKLNKITMDDIK
ncbi:MAG: hypothetical protein ACI35O_03375 [Bacillaceae bacterium]